MIAQRSKTQPQQAVHISDGSTARRYYQVHSVGQRDPPLDHQERLAGAMVALRQALLQHRHLHLLLVVTNREAPSGAARFNWWTHQLR